MSSSAAPIRVVLADDHPVVRRGLSALLKTLDGVEVVGQAGTGAEAIKEVALSRPDVVIMDLRMPTLDGVAATRQIVRDFPGTAVLVLTMFDEDAMVAEALRAGARGYLLKGADQDEIERAIRAVAGGDVIFTQAVAQGAGQLDRTTDLGLAGALRQKAAALNDARGARAEVRLQLPDELPPLSAAVELAAYRIVLEALANVARHSTGRHSDVRITAAEDLVVTVEDDGVPPPADWSPGVGLRSIADRAEELGGSATAGPSEQGWRVQAKLPLPPTP